MSRVSNSTEKKKKIQKGGRRGGGERFGEDGVGRFFPFPFPVFVGEEKTDDPWLSRGFITAQSKTAKNERREETHFFL